MSYLYNNDQVPVRRRRFSTPVYSSTSTGTPLCRDVPLAREYQPLSAQAYSRRYGSDWNMDQWRSLGVGVRGQSRWKWVDAEEGERIIDSYPMKPVETLPPVGFVLEDPPAWVKPQLDSYAIEREEPVRRRALSAPYYGRPPSTLREPHTSAPINTQAYCDGPHTSGPVHTQAYYDGPQSSGPIYTQAYHDGHPPLYTNQRLYRPFRSDLQSYGPAINSFPTDHNRFADYNRFATDYDRTHFRTDIPKNHVFNHYQPSYPTQYEPFSARYSATVDGSIITTITSDQVNYSPEKTHSFPTGDSIEGKRLIRIDSPAKYRSSLFDGSPYVQPASPADKFRSSEIAPLETSMLSGTSYELTGDSEEDVDTPDEEEDGDTVTYLDLPKSAIDRATSPMGMTLEPVPRSLYAKPPTAPRGSGTTRRSRSQPVKPVTKLSSRDPSPMRTSSRTSPYRTSPGPADVRKSRSQSPATATGARSSRTRSPSPETKPWVPSGALQGNISTGTRTGPPPKSKHLQGTSKPKIQHW